jgi:hypothetical protein
MIELSVISTKRNDKPPTYKEAIKTAKQNDGKFIY